MGSDLVSKKSGGKHFKHGQSFCKRKDLRRKYGKKTTDINVEPMVLTGARRIRNLKPVIGVLEILRVNLLAY